MGRNQWGALPAGQTDALDGVVAVVHLVAGLKHHAEAAAAQTLNRLKVCQVPAGPQRRRYTVRKTGGAEGAGQ